ncbi:MAG: hypothetical protein ACI4U4_01200 [Bacilli bacterium]
MDTVIANKYSSILNELNIEVSKKLEGEFDVDEIISTFGNYFFNKMFLDITAIKDYKNLTNLQKLSMGINMDKVILLLDREDPISDSNVFLSKLVGMGIYNFTKDKNNLMYLYTNPNLYRDVAYLQDVTINDDLNRPIVSTEKTIEKRMIGIKNITDSAGASTLIYLLKRELKEYYKVMALEIDKRDFVYFKDEDMINIREMELENIQNKYNDIEIFLVDLNKSKKDYLCTDVLYLIEPSTIKLNRLMMISPYIFQDLNRQKVVLNKSLLTESEISDFEAKSNIKIYYNIPPLNDKKNNDEILLPLLEKLGYIKVAKEKPKKRKNIFNLFK